MKKKSKPLIIEVSQPLEETVYSLKVKVSTTVQNIIKFDLNEGTYTAFVELDFKYPLDSFLETFDQESLSVNNPIRAKDISCPYIITNSTEVLKHRETHFFREVGKTSEDDLSMYGSPDNLLYSGLPGQGLWKCEKYCMTLVLSLSYVQSHVPFETHYLLIKIASDGRPGTEKVCYVFDHDDSVFTGFLKSINGYSPLDEKPIISQVSIFTPGQMVYPRIYIAMRYKGSPFDSLVKFYMVPSIMFCLLLLERVDGVDLLSLSASLALANIALLFIVSQKGVLTFQEQAVIFNTAALLFATIFLRYITSDSVYNNIIVILIPADILVTIILAVAQATMASKNSNHLFQLLKSNNFKEAMKSLDIM